MVNKGADFKNVINTFSRGSSNDTSAERKSSQDIIDETFLFTNKEHR